MVAEVPVYYRQFADRPLDRERGGSPTLRLVEPTTRCFRADTFALHLQDGWCDQSVYVLAGPTSHGLQHNVSVAVTYDLHVDRLPDFADWQIRAIQTQLPRCRLLRKDRVRLDCGRPAFRAIFVWHPDVDVRLYQQQLYVLHGRRGYTLTAVFSAQTRKQFGPRVERMMLTFDPAPDGDPPSRDGY